MAVMVEDDHEEEEEEEEQQQQQSLSLSLRYQIDLLTLLQQSPDDPRAWNMTRYLKTRSQLWVQRAAGDAELEMCLKRGDVDQGYAVWEEMVRERGVELTHGRQAMLLRMLARRDPQDGRTASLAAMLKRMAKGKDTRGVVRRALEEWIELSKQSGKRRRN
eukprot:gb/GECH01013116.1/.p1 GENE.gb/GECH01013116.1/~~gb/GECH01013116.1/.p1  ORF type:complete len:161 (+),score=41.98 gb/GECH01013116.1/:1-483(+)